MRAGVVDKQGHRLASSSPLTPGADPGVCDLGWA